MLSLEMKKDKNSYIAIFTEDAKDLNATWFSIAIAFLLYQFITNPTARKHTIDLNDEPTISEIQSQGKLDLFRWVQPYTNSNSEVGKEKDVPEILKSFYESTPISYIEIHFTNLSNVRLRPTWGATHKAATLTGNNQLRRGVLREGPIIIDGIAKEILQEIVSKEQENPIRVYLDGIIHPDPFPSIIVDPELSKTLYIRNSKIGKIQAIGFKEVILENSTVYLDSLVAYNTKNATRSETSQTLTVLSEHSREYNKNNPPLLGYNQAVFSISSHDTVRQLLQHSVSWDYVSHEKSSLGKNPFALVMLLNAPDNIHMDSTSSLLVQVFDFLQAYDGENCLKAAHKIIEPESNFKYETYLYGRFSLCIPEQITRSTTSQLYYRKISNKAKKLLHEQIERINRKRVELFEILPCTTTKPQSSTCKASKPQKTLNAPVANLEQILSFTDIDE